MLALYIILAVLAFLTVATFIIAYAAYRKAFFSVPNPAPDNYELPNSQQYRDNKERMYSLIKELEDIPFEEVTITSHDGLKLYGRYYHRCDGAPVHIEFHGYRSMAIRDFCGGDSIVRSLGHNTLLVDQRAHGKSEGHSITFGIKERRDCLDWINYVNERFGNDTKIFLIGVSMGAATVLMATEFDLPENVVGVMADSPFSSPWLVIGSVARKMHIPVKLAFPFVRLGAKVFGGFDLIETSAMESVKKAKVPILLVHGEADRLVPCHMSREIADNCASEITLITFPEIDHALSYIIKPEEYTHAAVKFVNKILEDKQNEAYKDI